MLANEFQNSILRVMVYIPDIISRRRISHNSQLLGEGNIN